LLTLAFTVKGIYGVGDGVIVGTSVFVGVNVGAAVSLGVVVWVGLVIGVATAEHATSRINSGSRSDFLFIRF
jgi:hypothetical protein